MARFRVLRAIPELCTGCWTCELVCSLEKTGRANPAYARLKIHRSSEDGACIPIICRHCKVPLCQKACPVPEAMYRDERTGAIVIDQEICNGCLSCADACPFDAIFIGPKGEVLKCDLCGGAPTCVKYCPPRPEQQFPHLPYPEVSALEYAEPRRVTREKVTAKS